MAYALFVVFLAVPLVEIALFILIGQHIGILATIAAIIGTALAGAVLVRHQGLATLNRARSELDDSRIPAGALAEGLAILLAGALLLTPGFFTDAIGFTLLVPPLRRWIVRIAGRWIGQRVSVVSTNPAGSGPNRGGSETVIEGEAVEVEDPPRGKPDPDSPWRDR